MKDSIKQILFGVFLFVLILAPAKNVSAQSLYLSPNSGEFNAGEIFTVKLKLESSDQTINAAQATANYPLDLLEVKSISKSSSIFIFWPEEPSFSNLTGIINFGGGLPSPGFNGTGTIININFKAKKEGKAVLSFSGGSILAADGRGTNVLNHTTGSIYIIKPASQIKETPQNKQLSEKQKNNFQNSSDVNPPDPFDIVIDNKGDITLPSPLLLFKAVDKGSGIKEYGIQIDGGNIIFIAPEKADPYILPNQIPGAHTVKVIAMDNAGNKRDSEANFYIKSISSPEILIYPQIYYAGDEMLYIEGKAIPDSLVKVSVKMENSKKTWEVLSDKEGSWSVFSNDLFRDGVYKLSAMTQDKRGALSEPSNEYEILVVLRGVSIGSSMFTFKDIVQFLILIIILIILLMIYLYQRIMKNKIKLKNEILKAQDDLKETFDDLKEKLSKKIEYFDSKPGLSVREKEVLADILKNINRTERDIGKDIEGIEKDAN